MPEAKNCNYCGQPLEDGKVCLECTLTDLNASTLLALRSASKPKGDIPYLVESRTQSQHPIVGPKYKIGRDPTNQMVIDSDAYASRFHAWITCEDGHYFLEDLGSTNGTLHNGEPVMHRRTLVNGDRVRVGRSDFTFMRESHSEAVQAASSNSGATAASEA